MPYNFSEFKGTFKKLKTRTEIIQDLATEMTATMANQGASAEAKEIITEVSDLHRLLPWLDMNMTMYWA